MLDLLTKETDQSPKILVINLKGSLDTTSSIDFYEYINSKLIDGYTKFIINCEQLNFISSAGISIILRLRKRLTDKRFTLVYTALNKEIQLLFNFFGLDKKLLFADNKESAKKIIENIQEPTEPYTKPSSNITLPRTNITEVYSYNKPIVEDNSPEEIHIIITEPLLDTQAQEPELDAQEDTASQQEILEDSELVPEGSGILEAKDYREEVSEEPLDDFWDVDLDDELELTDEEINERVEDALYNYNLSLGLSDSSEEELNEQETNYDWMSYSDNAPEEYRELTDEEIQERILDLEAMKVWDEDDRDEQIFDSEEMLEEFDMEKELSELSQEDYPDLTDEEIQERILDLEAMKVWDENDLDEQIFDSEEILEEFDMEKELSELSQEDYPDLTDEEIQERILDLEAMQVWDENDLDEQIFDAEEDVHTEVLDAIEDKEFVILDIDEINEPKESLIETVPDIYITEEEAPPKKEAFLEDGVLDLDKLNN